MNKAPLEIVVSARVTAEAKELMEKEGIKIRDALEYYMANHTTKKTRLEVKKTLIEKEINELEQELQLKKMQHEQIQIDLEGREMING